MSKVNKKTLKATQNRERVNFHRRWKFIASNGLNNISPRKTNSPVHEESKQSTKSDVIGSKERLRKWALKYNISKRAVSDLLTILISLGMSWLPKDSRTLLSTPREIHMTNLTIGKLWYALHFEYNRFEYFVIV